MPRFLPSTTISPHGLIANWILPILGAGALAFVDSFDTLVAETSSASGGNWTDAVAASVAAGRDFVCAGGVDVLDVGAAGVATADVATTDVSVADAGPTDAGAELDTSLPDTAFVDVGSSLACGCF